MHLPNIQSCLDRLTRFQIILLLTFLGLLAYGNAVNHPFVHDDVVFIQQNPQIVNLDLEKFFIQPSVTDSEFSSINQYYRPLLDLVNKILYRIVHLNPHGFHFFNILLHIANSFLVYNVIRVITDNKKGISLVTAIIFLLHPVQSEAVACIAGISNLVFAFLCLASFYTYVVSKEANGKKRNSLTYMLSLVLFSLALLAKEQSVVLPVLIVAYELCFKASLKKMLKRFWHVAGFFIVLAGYFLLRKFLFGMTLTHILAEEHELWLTLLAIPRSLLMYLGIIIFPHNLHYYRSQDILLPYMAPIIILLVIIGALIFLILRAPNPHRKWMVFGLSWFIVSMLPTLNIIPLVNEYSLILTAEHFLYFPIIGIILFAMGCSCFLFKRMNNEKKYFIYFLICSAATVFYWSSTIKQNEYWRGEIPLFERTLKFQKNFGRVHFLLGQAYAKAGRFEDAILEDHKALAIMQGYEQKVRDFKIKKFYLIFIQQIHYHLGYCLSILGDMKGSLDHYKEALSLDPDNEIYLFSVGNTYIQNDDMLNAIMYFEKITKLNEDNLIAANTLALCYQRIGKNGKAEKYLQLIVEKDSGSVSAKRNLEQFLKQKNSL